MKVYLITLLIFISSTCFAQKDYDFQLQPYINVLQEQGHKPIPFILNRLDSADLIIFDDAWHPGKDVFDFYQNLITHPEFQDRVRFIFIEAFSINKQPEIDAYFKSDPEDQSLLDPVFQDDFSGHGWRLKTYFDLLHTIYTINKNLPSSEQLSVIAVNAPTYWSEITTPHDIQLFRKSLMGNDYTMYRIILYTMDEFKSQKKGIFLTNTRHAYKDIRDRQNNLFWNTGTFFYQRHPGKTFAIRFHHLTLSISCELKPNKTEAATTAGMEKMEYRWIRMADGLWDSAFTFMNNKPVAFSLRDNIFGKEAYVGNHMVRAKPGQTMYDAYDALIFLKPLERLSNSAEVDFLCTPEFKTELARRFNILYTQEQLQKQMENANVKTITELVDLDCTYHELQPIQQVQSLGPINAWHTK